MTEANLCNKNLGEGGAIIISAWITHKDNGALTHLDVSKNNIGAVDNDGWSLHKADDGKTFYAKDGKSQWDPPEGWKSKSEGVIAIADAIRNNGAMTSLNLASNDLGAEGAKIVAEAIKVTKCTPAIILAPSSCPSDFSINCCCLLLSAGYEGTIVLESCKQQYWGMVQDSWKHKQQIHRYARRYSTYSYSYI
jgi:hypothetical protein